MPKGYDFSGWVTKNDILCSDGVVIKQNAFKDNHNRKVPLVWNHNHNDSSAVVGHILLQSRDKGVYGYGFFNNSDKALDAKEAVQHGDIVAMSIAANGVQKAPNRRDVLHGNIFEVSLVFAGANPGAMIDNIVMHSDQNGLDEIILYTDCIIHSAINPDDIDPEEDEDEYEYGEGYQEMDDEADYQEEDEEEMNYNVEQLDEELVNEVAASLTEDELEAVYDFTRGMVGEDVPDEELMESLTEEQQEAVADFIQEILESDDDEEDYADYEEDEDVRHNAFANQLQEDAVLMHSQLCADILADARRNGSLKEAMVQHEVSSTVEDLMHGITGYEGGTLQHGVSTVDDLLTVETFEGAPINIKPEQTSIVDEILSDVKSTPKHTVRGRWADLTTEEARAKGYIKGNQKVEEIFGTLQRVTHPQTIYKKQSIDNDDLIDIDWDIISYLKAEMKEMWRYEVARDIFMSDGRLSSSADKVKETCIRPIMTDDPLFVTTIGSVTANNFLEKVITAMAVDYKGTGTPKAYADRVLIAQIRLLKASDGHFLWGDRPLSKADLADLIGVSKIVEPDFMLNTSKAVIVNLKDYELAAPNKGKSQSYEDFDIDFNKHKYLLEGRCAGALNTPKAALVFTAEAINAESYTQTTVPNEAAFKAGTFYILFAGVYVKAPAYNSQFVYYTKDEA